MRTLGTTKISTQAARGERSGPRAGLRLLRRLVAGRRALALVLVVAGVLSLSASPASAAAASGDGTLTVDKTSVVAGTTTFQPIFTFSVANGASNTFPSNSSLTITVPANWTTPTTTAGTPGYTTVTNGTCTPTSISTTGMVITVTHACAGGSSFSIKYGDGTSATHVTPPTTAMGFTFATTSKSGSASAVALTAGSPSITVNPAAATKLAFSAQPGGGTGGTTWSAQPAVTVQDTYNNVVTASTASVALAITVGTGTSAAALSCTTNPQSAGNVTAGVVTFAGCKIDKISSGYTLTATSSGLTSASSAAFNVTQGAGTQLAFTASPSASTGGTAFTTQPVVTVQDAGGNLVNSSTIAVTLAITGANLTCTTNPQTASSGTVTFTGCSIDKAGTYTVTASSSGLTSATASVQITVGPAAKLGYSTQPSASSISGTAFAAQPVVAVQDAGGNTVTANTSTVSLTLTGTGPSAAALTCTTNSKAASSGVVSFSGCKVDKSGSGYTLTASSAGLTSAISTAFAITAGTATKLVFSTQPGSGTGGTALGTQPVVTVQDANGNTVTTDASSVTLAITGGTGTSGATLTCTANSQAAGSGVATFTGCSIDKAGTGYTLTASDGTLTTAVSSTITVTVGPAAKLALTTQPAAGSSVTAGSSIPVVVAEQDAGGNTVATDSATAVSLTLASGTGLSCPGNPTTLTSGTASYTCSLTLASSGYALKATTTSLSVTGNSFTVVAAAASKLAYTTQPTGATAGATLASFAAAVQDTYGNTVTTGTGSTDAVTVSVATGPGAASGTLSASAAAGVATFGSVTLTTAGSYTLKVTDTTRTLITAASNSFTIAAAAPIKLAIVQGPTDAFAGTAMTPAVTVQVQDTYGNATATNGVLVTLAPSSGSISSGATATSSTSGLATFTSLTFNSTTLGVTLTASASGYTPTAASAVFNVTVPVTTTLNALTDTAADPNGTNGAGVASVSYYFCTGLTGACTNTNWSLIGTSASSAGSYNVNWTNQPSNGSYRVVVVAQDNAGNASSVSAATPVTVSN